MKAAFPAAVVCYFAVILWVAATLRRPSLPYRGPTWLAAAFFSAVSGVLALAGANGGGLHRWIGTFLGAAGAVVAAGGWAGYRREMYWKHRLERLEAAERKAPR